MIKEHSIHPKPQNKKSRALMWAFFAAAFVTVIVSIIIDKYRGVVGLCGFSLLVTAILIYTKYVSVEFYYDIVTEGYDEPLFIVRQTVGKRNVTLCRIELSSIESITRESAAERRQNSRAMPKGVLLYSYMPSLAPAVSYRMLVKRGGAQSAILIELSDEMADLLREYAAIARQTYPETEE